MELLHNIPQPLYKYRLWFEPNIDCQYSRKIITDNEIYLASPDQFNDPFENGYPFRYRDQDMTPDNIFLKLIEVGRQQWPDISDAELHQRCFERQNSGVFDSDKYWMELHEEFKEQNNKLFGIFSTTSKNDNLLMWSHYADSHRGFCIGFDKFILFPLIHASLGPVLYETEFPKIGMFDRSDGTLTRILSTKSIDWKYEDEYRFIKMNGARTIINFPNEAVLEVILGHAMKEEYKDEIVKIVKAKFIKAKTYQSQVDLKEFKLNMIPIL